MTRTPLWLTLAMALLAVACSEPDTTADATPGGSTSSTPASEAAAPAETASAGAAAEDPHAGVNMAAPPPARLRNAGQVLVAESAGGYSYLRVQTRNGPVWLATMQTDVRTGDQVGWGQAALMRNFHSKALDRTFDRILFVQGVARVGQQAAAGGNTGEVLEVAEGGGYSFVRVAGSGGDGWIAAPQTPVAVGDTVRWTDGAVMQNFASASLDRTFDRIVFSSGITVVQ